MAVRVRATVRAQAPQHEDRALEAQGGFDACADQDVLGARVAPGVPRARRDREPVAGPEDAFDAVQHARDLARAHLEVLGAVVVGT